MKELEEEKSKEALLLVLKKRTLWKYQNAREVARRLQRFGRLKKDEEGGGLQDLFSFESCRSSVVASPRRMQDEQEVMSEEKKTRGGWNQEEEET